MLIVLNAQCAQCLICIDQHVPRPPVLRLLQRLAQIPPEPRHSQFLLLTCPREQNWQDWCKINRWPLHDFRCINLFPLTTRRSTIIDFQCFNLFLLITDKWLLTSDAPIHITSSSIRQVTTWCTDLRLLVHTMGMEFPAKCYIAYHRFRHKIYFCGSSTHTHNMCNADNDHKAGNRNNTEEN